MVRGRGRQCFLSAVGRRSWGLRGARRENDAKREPPWLAGVRPVLNIFCCKLGREVRSYTMKNKSSSHGVPGGSVG